MNVFSSACPSRTVLDHITSKWGVLIIVALSDATLRWGELRRTIDGISEKMLAQTLRVLENDGLVLRTVQGTIPPRVDYQLTELGHDLCDTLIPLLRWVGSNAGEILASAAAAASAAVSTASSSAAAPATASAPVPA
ncbi:winged helix-turn-helix transcriptional regulator [Subtercola sp. YIM 133946]|uniref:winged helix-turn-helix transcriptional regulator n=1 Tax=Subtercola sp. YIM 133946 TaxID=3118909 RepID=UPI002F94708B